VIWLSSRSVVMNGLRGKRVRELAHVVARKFELVHAPEIGPRIVAYGRHDQWIAPSSFRL